ncbi:MAG: hypothetical protein H0X33_06510 [Taibaiella sp.]|nr:hypothetical protein [Taibaiella sp.]
MKQIKLSLLTIASGLVLFTSCSKSGSDATNISKPPLQIGQALADNVPCGAVKGTMLSGHTYTISCPISVNAGDTLYMQNNVTVNVTNPQASIAVKGIMISAGTKTQPNTITVPGLTKTDNLTAAANTSADPAYKGNWCGIQCDTSCKMFIMKWTHLEFGGATYVTPPLPVFTAGGISYVLYFSNPNGICVFEDSWIYGAVDDAVRFAGGKISFQRNTIEKAGAIGGDVFNAKHGTVGIMAYNLFVGTATNGTKASDKGSSTAPACHIDMYNNTYINGGYRQIQTGRGGDVNYEQGSYGQAYNNLMVNCKFGFRIVGNPIADTANCHYGYSYQYGDADSIVNQFYPVAYVTIPKSSDIPAPSSFLNLSTYMLGDVYSAHSLVDANNPQFANYPLPSPSGNLVTYASGFDFHLKSTSPAIGKGFTGFTPIANAVPVDSVFGASELTPPGIDMGAYQSNGTGNHH